MTQNDLTLALNKSYNYINSVEQGKIMPSLEVIEQISEVLDIKASRLFEEDASPQNIKSFSKEEYINGISENLYDRLKNLISNEIKNTLN